MACTVSMSLISRKAASIAFFFCVSDSCFEPDNGSTFFGMYKGGRG